MNNQRTFARGIGRTLSILTLWVMLGLVSGVRADLFSTYSNVGTIVLPVGTTEYDVAPDGRIIALVGADVFSQDTAGGNTFSIVGTLPAADIASFGAAFIAVSPDGTKIAVGNNGGATFTNFQVGVFDSPALTGTWTVANHFTARWLDNDRLILAASDFTNGSSLTVLDTSDANPANWSNTTVVVNIGGASGGIAIDPAGNLYTANGFASIGPSGTGAVKAFAPSLWLAALSGGVAVDFENSGTLVVDILSGSPLGFDVEGNLLVGGGDVAPDDDSVAIVRASAVAASLAGMGPVDVNDPSQVRRVDPDTASAFNFYSVIPNLTVGEFYVRDFGAQTLFVYCDPAPIPTMGDWGIACMSLGLLCAGSVVLRRSTPNPVIVR